MTTVATIRDRIKSLLGTDPSLSDAEILSVIQARYTDLYESYAWSRRTRDFTLAMIAQVESSTSDTVSVTLDSDVVTSSGTPFASNMVGRQIQIGDEPQYFFVRTFTSSSVVTLGDGEGNSVVWPRASASGATWRIFQTLYSLPADAESIVSLSSDVTLSEIDGGRAALDRIDPNRDVTGDIPDMWAYANVDATNSRQIEVWPVPSTAALLRGQYFRLAPTLNTSTEIDIPVSVLEYAATADCAHVLFAKQGAQDPTYQQLANFYEAKLRNAISRYRLLDKERISPVRSLSLHRGRGLRGTDFEVDHQLDFV